MYVTYDKISEKNDAMELRDKVLMNRNEITNTFGQVVVWNFASLNGFGAQASQG